MGAELRFPLRKTPDTLWGYLSTRADDDRLDQICAKPDGQTGQGHVDRAYYHADVVIRA